MTTAFVLSGGGSLGAVQVGMLQALAAHGVRPDLLVGTSAGAMNAAWVGAHGGGAASLDGLAQVWTRLRRQDVFPLEARTAMRGLFGGSPAMVSPERLRRLVAACAGIDTLDQALVPVHLVTADLVSGRTVTLSDGPLVSGVLASAAIPGVFPPVERGGRLLVDGGVALDTGVTVAVGLGATLVYVLPAGTACAPAAPPASALATALHALTLLIEQRLARDVARLAAAATIKVLPPLCPLSTSPFDFSHGAELIGRSRGAAEDWITRGDIDLAAPERFLAAHRHRSSPPAPVATRSGGP